LPWRPDAATAIFHAIRLTIKPDDGPGLALFYPESVRQKADYHHSEIREPDMQTNLTPALIRKLLVADLAHARQLEQLLTREREYLEQRQLAALENLLPVKAGLLAKMEKNDIARKSWLDESGFSADRKGLRACCEHLDQLATQSVRNGEKPGFSVLSNELHEQLDKCRVLIDIIGSIVHRSRSDTRKLLGILRGSPGQDNNTYTQRGDTSQRQDSRQLGSA